MNLAKRLRVVTALRIANWGMTVGFFLMAIGLWGMNPHSLMIPILLTFTIVGLYLTEKLAFEDLKIKIKMYVDIHKIK